MGDKLPEILTETEEKALLDQFNIRYQTSYRNKLMIQLALKTGMRISEVLALQWKDLESEASGVKIYIREGKGGKDRVVYLKLGVYEDITHYYSKFKLIPDGLVFTTTKGRRIQARYVRQMLQKKVQKAGINKHIHFHSLRHTALTRFYSQTKDIRLVQQIAGHKNIQTTTIYTHLSGADIQAAMLK